MNKEIPLSPSDPIPYYLYHLVFTVLQYGIPKSDEFLSFVKFDVWFCDSLVNLPYSKSIHWSCRQCAHCDVVRFFNAFLYCQCFL